MSGECWVSEGEFLLDSEQRGSTDRSGYFCQFDHCSVSSENLRPSAIHSDLGAIGVYFRFGVAQRPQETHTRVSRSCLDLCESAQCRAAPRRHRAGFHMSNLSNWHLFKLMDVGRTSPWVNSE